MQSGVQCVDGRAVVTSQRVRIAQIERHRWRLFSVCGSCVLFVSSRYGACVSMINESDSQSISNTIHVESAYRSQSRSLRILYERRRHELCCCCWAASERLQQIFAVECIIHIFKYVCLRAIVRDCLPNKKIAVEQPKNYVFRANLAPNDVCSRRVVSSPSMSMPSSQTAAV